VFRNLIRQRLSTRNAKRGAHPGLGPGLARTCHPLVAVGISIVLGLSITIGSATSTSGVASADPGTTYCAHGANAGANGCRNGSGGEQYAGAYGEWHSNNMYLDGAHYNLGYHVNEEIWLYTTSSLRQFVEVGLRNGYASWNPCQCVAYAVFWAEFDTGGNEHPHWIANTTPDGINHVYEIQLTGTNVWSVYFDFNLQGSTSFQTSSVAYEDEVGSEITAPPGVTVGSWAHIDTFDQVNLETLSTAGYQWTFWPYMYTWIDQKCGTNGWTVPNCLDGRAPSSSYWQNWKQ
jgi:hypothetical protein